MPSNAITDLKNVSFAQIQTAVAEALEKLTQQKYQVTISRFEFENSPAVAWMPPHAAKFDVHVGEKKDYPDGDE